MKLALNFLKVSLFFFLISNIKTDSALKELEDYTMEFYYRISMKEGQSPLMLLTTSCEDSYLFNNPERPLYQKLPKDDDEFKTQVEMFKYIIPEFEFEIKEDDTGLKNQVLQGILGLGNDDGENKILDTLKKYKIIKKRVFYLDFRDLKNQANLVTIEKDHPSDYETGFTDCKMYSKKGLDDIFDEMWVCELSHIYLPNSTNVNQEELTLEDTLEVKSRAAFDLKSNYITAPANMLETFQKHFNSSGISCSTFTGGSFTYLRCKILNQDFSNVKPVYFLFDGYLYTISPQKLFYKFDESGMYSCLIRFMGELQEENIWVLGYPIFSSFEIKLDFDNNSIGFKNGKAIDMREKWIEWKANNSNFFADLFTNPVFLGVTGGVLTLAVALVLFFTLRDKCLKKKETNLIEGEENK